MAVRRRDQGCYLSGLQSCASVWSCPVCQAKIGQRRAVEVAEGVASWFAGGGMVHFVTFTVPHRRLPDGSVVPLSESFENVAACFRRFLQGRSWRQLRSTFGIAGYLRTLEATYGHANGWHPHIHALVFTGAMPEEKAHKLYRALFARWQAVVRRDVGLEVAREAFDAEPVRSSDDVARYLVKLGLEMFRHDLKEGKRPGRFTPWQVLDAADNGEAWALLQWWTWERVTQGRRCMTWSRGLRKLLGLVRVAATDEELAVEDQGGEVVAMIDGETWYRATSIRGMDARVLSTAEQLGSSAVHLLLATVRQRT